MGRHAAMKPAADKPQRERVPAAYCHNPETHAPEKASAVSASAGTDWTVIDECNMERRTALAAVDRDLPRSPHRDLAIAVAIAICVLTPDRSPAADRDAVTAVAWVLLTDADGRGHVDPVAALEPRAIERVLDRNTRGWSRTSMPTYRGYLTAAGRVVRPADFPPLRLRAIEAIRDLRAGGPTKSSPWRVASDVEVANAYSLTKRDAAVARRTEVILDLVTGAGLRASELRQLRICDINEVRLPRGLVLAAVTTSATNFATKRTVPVVDEGKAHRLLDFCRGKPAHHLVLAPDGVYLERNAVNRPAERLRAAGYPGFDVEALRNGWILAMACRVPTAILASLADISQYDLHRMVLASVVDRDVPTMAAYLRAVAS